MMVTDSTKTFNSLAKLFDDAKPVYEDMEKSLENGHLIKTQFEKLDGQLNRLGEI